MSELAQRFGFDEWRERNRLKENLFVRGFFLGGWEVPTWHILRNRLLLDRDDMRARAAYLSDQEIGDGRGRGMTVDSYECRSLVAAHEHLLQLLGEFELPAVTERADELGDVGFSVRGDHVVVFARGNLVLRVARAERAEVPVLQVCQQLDAILTTKEHEEGPVKPVAGASINKDGGLELVASEPLGRPVWFKVFAYGELHAAGGRVLYRRAGLASEQADVIALNENGGAARVKLAIG